MYENNFPNENHDNGLSTEQNTDLKVTGGIFSSQTTQSAQSSQTAQSAQTSQDTYRHGGRENSYYGDGRSQYGYNTAGAYQSPNVGQNTGSYQYGNSYPNDYGNIGTL